MHSKETIIRLKTHFEKFIRLQKKTEFSKSYLWHNFATEKYRAVESNGFFQRQRGLAVKELTNFYLGLK